MAVLFVSQPVTSPLARNSSTQESKCRAICFNCKIPNHLLDAYTHSIAVDMRTIGLHTGWLNFFYFLFLHKVEMKPSIPANVWFTKDSCFLSHGKLWMWGWRMDTGHEDWWHPWRLMPPLRNSRYHWIEHRQIKDVILVFQRTFHYDSHFWSNRNGYNFAGGKTGFDSQETKLPTYWSTSFSKICLGMKIGHQLRFIVINRHANSLFSLIADGKYRATSLGRNTWKWLIGSRASLQRNCNKEGFNAVGSNPRYSKARIGITANQQNHCGSCNSRIGFGTGGLFNDSNTCGNEATHSPDNGHKHIKAMGYILVQWQGTQLTSQILSREAIMKKKMSCPKT